MFIIGARIYMKPLGPGDMGTVDLDRVMRAGKRALLRRLRGKLLQQTTFSPQAKAALAQSIQVKVLKSSIQIGSNHPGFLPLIKGQKKSQMQWLVKARVPIPIILDNGQLIFRNASPASMARGRWWHPGRGPTDYVEKAKELGRDFIRKKFMSEMERIRKLRMSTLPSQTIKTRR